MTEQTSEEKVVDVFEELLAANNRQAAANRVRFDTLGLRVLNLISSPGSGKTSLLEKTIALLRGEAGIGVIEGDPETERDAARIRQRGVPAIQLTTGGGCHLDAAMVQGGLEALEKAAAGKKLDFLFIENVGNLVCPASYALGEHRRVVLLSVPEGSDKPAKYPATFRTADLVLITKIDLLPYFDFNVHEVRETIEGLKPGTPVFALSSEKGEGMVSWLEYLHQLLREK